MKKWAKTWLAMVLSSSVCLATQSGAAEQQVAMAAPPLVVVPEKRDDDLRVFLANGEVVKGAAALELMAAGKTDLNVWVAGNQFFAMEDVARGFQKAHDGKPAVGVITLPPGLVLNAALAGGWKYGDKEYRFRPDVIGQVDVASLQKLKQNGLAELYVTYMHNELTLMVSKGNPKQVKGIDDLGRADLQVMLPNPITEGIMKIYAKPVLQTRGLWDKLANGQECESCRTRPNVYFTSVHHREIPEGIKKGETDVGIVWATEVKHALAEGAPVESVTLPVNDSLKNEVIYVAAPLRNAAHAKYAEAYIAYLGSPAGQDAYSNHGFVRADADEMIGRVIP